MPAFSKYEVKIAGQLHTVGNLFYFFPQM